MLFVCAVGFTTINANVVVANNTCNNKRVIVLIVIAVASVVIFWGKKNFFPSLDYIEWKGFGFDRWSTSSR
jgi:hypothetical protein